MEDKEVDDIKNIINEVHYTETPEDALIILEHARSELTANIDRLRDLAEANKVKTFQVMITREESYRMTVEAKNEEEAKELAESDYGDDHSLGGETKVISAYRVV